MRKNQIKIVNSKDLDFRLSDSLIVPGSGCVKITKVEWAQLLESNRVVRKAYADNLLRTEVTKRRGRTNG